MHLVHTTEPSTEGKGKAAVRGERAGPVSPGERPLACPRAAPPPAGWPGPWTSPPALRPARTCSLTRPGRPSPAPAPRTPTTASCAPTSVRPGRAWGPPPGAPPLEAPPLTAAPPLGGAPVEELRHLAQANVSMDIYTFTNLNPRVLQVGGGCPSGGVGEP